MIYSYEGWYALYSSDGEKLMETDNLADFVTIDIDYDKAYEWFDDPEIGGFPERLP